MKDIKENSSLNIVENKGSFTPIVSEDMVKLINFRCEIENFITLTCAFARKNITGKNLTASGQANKELEDCWLIINANADATLFCNHNYSFSPRMSSEMVASIMMDYSGLFPFLLFIINEIECVKISKEFSFKGLIVEDCQHGLLCAKVSEFSIINQKNFYNSVQEAIDFLKSDGINFGINSFNIWFKNNIEHPIVVGETDVLDQDRGLKPCEDKSIGLNPSESILLDIFDDNPTQVENKPSETRTRRRTETFDQGFTEFADENIFANHPIPRPALDYPPALRTLPVKRPSRPQNKISGLSGYIATRGVEILNDWSFKFLSDTGAFKAIEPSQLIIVEGASLNCIDSRIFTRFETSNNTSIYVFDARVKEISDRDNVILSSLSNGEIAVCLINNGDSIGDKCKPFVTHHIKFPQDSSWLVGLVDKLWKPEYGEDQKIFVDKLEKACDLTLSSEYDQVVLNWLVIDDWWLEGKEQSLVRAVKAKNLLLSKQAFASVKVLDQISDGEKAEVKKWQVLLQPLSLRGRTDPDLIYRSLQQEFPWMAAANEILARSAAICNWSNQGYYKLTKPIMLLGRPGIGKTRWAYRVADILGLDMSALQASGVASSMSLLGAERGWSTAHPSFPARAMWSTRTANPLLFIDEIDKVADGNQNGSVVEALIPMLEKISSKRYPDNFLQGNLNLSYCSWLLAVNSVAGVSQTLMDRVVLVKVNPPEQQHFEIIRLGILKDLADEFGIMVEDLPDISSESEIYKRTYLENLSVRSLQTKISESINKQFWQPPKPKLVT